MNIELRLSRLKVEFAEWRKNKKSRTEPIPKPLMTKARKLCQHIKPFQVATELKIDSTKLKGSVANGKQRRTSRSRLAVNKFVNVELGKFGGDIPASVDSGFRCEWERGDGAKLRIDIGTLSLSEIVSGFLTGGGALTVGGEQ